MFSPYEFGQVMAGFCDAVRAAPSSPVDGDQSAQLLKEIQSMSEKLTSVEAKVDAILASEAALQARLDARDKLLEQAQTDRDAAVASVAEAQTEITVLKAKLAASPNDTADEEQRLDAVLTKLATVQTGLDGMELTPAAVSTETGAAITTESGAAVSADPAPTEPTAPATPVTTTAEPTSTAAAPAKTDPAAPTSSASL